MKPIHCDNCEWEGDLDGEDYLVLDEVEDLETRLEPGREVPAGECSDCGALVYMGPQPKEGKDLTIDEATIILSNRIQPSGDGSAIKALDTITQAFGGAEKRFFCPECGGSHFGSSGCQTEEMTRSCHSCRKVPHFSWPEKDDDKYFRWVITLPANMIEDKPKSVTGTSCEEDP